MLNHGLYYKVLPGKKGQFRTWLCFSHLEKRLHCYQSIVNYFCKEQEVCGSALRNRSSALKKRPFHVCFCFSQQFCSCLVLLTWEKIEKVPQGLASFCVKSLKHESRVVLNWVLFLSFHCIAGKKETFHSALQVKSRLIQLSSQGCKTFSSAFANCSLWH